MAEVRVDPLQLALRYGFQGNTQDGYHLANGMFAPWDSIKRMAFEWARLMDENDELRKLLLNVPND